MLEHIWSLLVKYNRILERNWFTCLPAFIIKFALVTVVVTPFNILRCFFGKNPNRDTDFDDRPCNGRWDSETCCLPVKSHCGPNGRNAMSPDGRYRRFMYLPFGITEVALAVCGVMAFWFSYTLPGAPIAWHTAGRIDVRPGALQDPADYTWILGNYEAYKNKLVHNNNSMEWRTHDGIVFALWDKFHLPGFDPKPNDAVSQEAFKAQSGFIAFNASNPVGHYTWEKAPITGISETFDDVIVYSNNCFCRGVYPEKGYMNKRWCKKQEKAGNCKPLSGGTLMPLADMAMQVRLCTQQQWLEVHQWPRWFALTAVLARVWYVFYCPRHLTMPGTQWMHPFWTGVAGYILKLHAEKMRMLLTTKPIYGLPSKWGIYLVPPMLFKGGKFGGPYHGFNHPTATIYKHLEKQVNWSLYLVYASAVCMFLSQYAYCTDCTHYSMLEDNLNLLKKKAADRVAKKNSIVFGRKTM